MKTGQFNPVSCRRRNPLRGWLIGRKLRMLDLDSAQLAQLDELFTRARWARKQHYNASSVLQQHVEALVTDAGFDRGRAVELIRSAAADDAERQSGVADALTSSTGTWTRSNGSG